MRFVKGDVSPSFTNVFNAGQGSVKGKNRIVVIEVISVRKLTSKRPGGFWSKPLTICGANFAYLYRTFEFDSCDIRRSILVRLM